VHSEVELYIYSVYFIEVETPWRCNEVQNRLLLIPEEFWVAENIPRIKPVLYSSDILHWA